MKGQSEVMEGQIKWIFHVFQVFVLPMLLSEGLWLSLARFCGTEQLLQLENTNKKALKKLLDNYAPDP